MRCDYSVIHKCQVTTNVFLIKYGLDTFRMKERLLGCTTLCDIMAQEQVLVKSPALDMGKANGKENEFDVDGNRI